MQEVRVNYIELIVYKTLFDFSRSLNLDSESLKELSRSIIHTHIENNAGHGLLNRKHLQDYLDLADSIIEIALKEKPTTNV